MPRKDGTGPMGLGSMKGWGMGFCSMPGGYASRSFVREAGLMERRGFRRMLCLTGLVSGCAYLMYRLANRKGR